MLAPQIELANTDENPFEQNEIAPQNELLVDKDEEDDSDINIDDDDDFVGNFVRYLINICLLYTSPSPRDS